MLEKAEPIALGQLNAAWGAVWATWAAAVSNVAVVATFGWLTVTERRRNRREQLWAQIEMIDHGAEMILGAFEFLDNLPGGETAPVDRCAQTFQSGKNAIITALAREIHNPQVAVVGQRLVTTADTLMGSAARLQSAGGQISNQAYLNSEAGLRAMVESARKILAAERPKIK